MKQRRFFVHKLSALLLTFLLVSAPKIVLSAPNPYRALLTGEVDKLWIELAKFKPSDNVDYSINPIRVSLDTHEVGSINLIFKARSDNVTEVLSFNSGLLSPHAPVSSTTLIGSIEYRSNGRSNKVQGFATFTRDSSRNMLRAYFALPRRLTGKNSQYTIKIKEGSKVARVQRSSDSQVKSLCSIPSNPLINSASSPITLPGTSGIGMFRFTAILDKAFQDKAGGSGAAALVDSLIANTDRIYQSYAGFQIKRENIVLLSSEDDSKYFQTTNADQILSELRSLVGQGKFGTGNIFHLFTGKSSTFTGCGGGGGSAVGCAVEGGTCSGGAKNYGTVVHRRDSELSVILPHELGHNLGASHDSSLVSGHETIMHPVADPGNFGFSPTSVSQMEQSRACAAQSDSTTPTPVATVSPVPTSGDGGSGGGNDGDEDQGNGDNGGGSGGNGFLNILFGIIKALLKIFTFGFGPSSNSVLTPIALGAAVTEYAYSIEVSRGPKYVEGVECKVRLDLSPVESSAWSTFSLGKTKERYFKYEFPLSSKPVTERGKPISLKMRVGFKCDDGSKYVAPTFRLPASQIKGQKKPFKKWLKDLRVRLGQYGDEIFS